MIVDINGLKVNLIGDPHLGREFKEGVPLHRLGEREEMVWASFKEALSVPCDVSVCMGDLFDKFVVPPEIVLRAAELYRKQGGTGREFVILRGNHDASRDVDRRSSYDLFSEILRGTPGVMVVKDEPMLLDYPRATNLAFFPWHPFINAAEMVDKLEGDFVAAFGHWDRVAFGDHRDNLIPLDQLAGRCKLVFSGHDHNPCRYDDRGVEVVYTGSLQPYSHGEDPDGDRYVTVYGADALDKLGDAAASKCIRLRLERGSDVPPRPDCLQFQIDWIDPEEAPKAELDLESFSVSKILSDQLKERKVGEVVHDQVMGQYEEIAR